MRIISQCDETEARKIFATPCDKSDVWVGYSKDGFQGMASYSVFGYTIGGPVKRLFAVEECYVDNKGSLDCANQVCIHAVGKYLARYRCQLGARIGEFGAHGGNYKVERMWCARYGHRVRIIGGRSHAWGHLYYS